MVRKLGIKPEDMARPLRPIDYIWVVKARTEEAKRRPRQALKEGEWGQLPPHFTKTRSKLILLPPLHNVEKFNEERACIGHKI